jgi:hypothetical protein
LRTRKIRFYPNPTQKAFLRKCFDTSRFIYNRAVAGVHGEAYRLRRDAPHGGRGHGHDGYGNSPVCGAGAA